MKDITILLSLSTASVLLANTVKAEAMTFKCFNRSTGEQVAESTIDITTPAMSCIPADGSNPVRPFTPERSTPKLTTNDENFRQPQRPGKSTNSSSRPDPLAAKRAINLARGTAIKLNGGLSQYRPGNCMFTSTVANPCITQANDSGFEFRIPGGAPGWEQNGENPTVLNIVRIAPDGRSVLGQIQK
ncbi:MULTISPECIES: hypothetical protein [Prochlorococcus]|uniref:hypothetical protein n=1 Tax=Prochlorococcus TaxID=1218 RepID=UPI0007BB6C02|nr:MULTISPECIES: hypothetical protein [Prochlorococcus]KZR64655.1 hypothetical protein PMIT1312_01374 [Prochlorococcus marinus str. MIT 1312]KZR79220.1 hypothetical protein PMIT1327_02427 [Prochlorococcus marinus str. MIT 1327]